MAKKIAKAQLKRDLEALKEEKNALLLSNKEQKTSFNEKMDVREAEYEEQLNQEKEKYVQKLDELKQVNIELELQNKEKQKQLDRRELKKLAIAYKDQEDEYVGDLQRWFYYVMGAFLALITFGAYSISFFQEVVWSEKIELYFLNFIIVTFLVFALKQFSYYTKLRTDYANRKTLAQSYHNILNTAEDEDLRPAFIDKASDVLFAKTDVKHESYTLPEKLLESLTEISKNLKKGS